MTKKHSLDLKLIKCLFLFAGFLLNLCSTFRRSFMTRYFGLTDAQFSIFSSLAFPVAFGCGLLWTILHKSSTNQFRTLLIASVLALASFSLTLPASYHSKLLASVFMLGYVGMLSAITPIICILTFQALTDRTYFGQHYVFCVLGGLAMNQVVQLACRFEKSGTCKWTAIYPLALAVHVLFYIAVCIIDRIHRRNIGGEEKMHVLQSSVDSISSKDSGEFIIDEDDAVTYSGKNGLPLYFDNSPHASTIAGSSFAFTKRNKLFPFSTSTATSFLKKTNSSPSLLHNKRFVCVLACGFLISLSSNLMKILLPSYLEDYVKVNAVLETFISSAASVAEFFVMISFPWISRKISFQNCFLTAVALYFLYMTCFSLLPASALTSASTSSKFFTAGKVTFTFVLFAPLKGIASGLLNCSSSLLVSTITRKNSAAQKIYSAVVSMLAGSIAGLYGAWIASRSDSIIQETWLVFRHCFLWCFIAFLASVYVFLMEKEEASNRNENFRYEALLFEN